MTCPNRTECHTPEPTTTVVTLIPPHTVVPSTTTTNCWNAVPPHSSGVCNPVGTIVTTTTIVEFTPPATGFPIPTYVEPATTTTTEFDICGDFSTKEACEEFLTAKTSTTAVPTTIATVGVRKTSVNTLPSTGFGDLGGDLMGGGIIVAVMAGIVVRLTRKRANRDVG